MNARKARLMILDILSLGILKEELRIH